MHVEEEVPEEMVPGVAIPLLPEITTKEAPEMIRVEKATPTPSVFVELGEKELEAVTVRPAAVERVEGAPQLNEEGAGSKKRATLGRPLLPGCKGCPACSLEGLPQLPSWQWQLELHWL